MIYNLFTRVKITFTIIMTSISINWQCKDCSTLSGLFDLNCRECGRQRQNPGAKKDWLCPKCNQMIFASKNKCLKCNSK